MKKSVAVALLLGILLISPLIHAQAQAETYSGFNRFIDNVRMFFTSGDNKVLLALEIREKEVNSAIGNIEKNNTGGINKNLENAFDKLIFVQEKVSPEIADEVETSVNRTIEKIEASNLTNALSRYVLEEKKTELVAKLVVEVEGKEGQTLTREVVKNGTGGRNMIKIVVVGENGEIMTTETEGEIGKINNQIAEHTYAGGKGVVVQGNSGGEAGVVVEGGVEVNTGGNGTEKDEALPEPDLNKVNPDLYNPDARAPGDTIDETYDDESPSLAEGTSAEGANTPAP